MSGVTLKLFPPGKKSPPHFYPLRVKFRPRLTLALTFIIGASGDNWSGGTVFCGGPYLLQQGGRVRWG